MKIDKRKGLHARPIRKEKLVRRKFYTQDQRKVVLDYKNKSLLNRSGGRRLGFLDKKKGHFVVKRRETKDS